MQRDQNLIEIFNNTRRANNAVQLTEMQWEVLTLLLKRIYEYFIIICENSRITSISHSHSKIISHKNASKISFHCIKPEKSPHIKLNYVCNMHNVHGCNKFNWITNHLTRTEWVGGLSTEISFSEEWLVNPLFFGGNVETVRGYASSKNTLSGTK